MYQREEFGYEMRTGYRLKRHNYQDASITNSDLESLIITAVEGGTNYWMGIDTGREEWKDRPGDMPASQWIAQLLVEGKSVYLWDIENSNSAWELTMEKLLKGLYQNSRERPGNSLVEEMDAVDADCVFQYALFGKVEYG